jgi:hypothetical protein
MSEWQHRLRAGLAAALIGLGLLGSVASAVAASEVVAAPGAAAAGCTRDAAARHRLGDLRGRHR